MKTLNILLAVIFFFLILAGESFAQMSWKIRLEAKDRLEKIVPPPQPKVATVLSGSTDIRVHSSTNNQSEVSISINPADLNKLLIGANTDPGQGYYYSTNGGTNWSGGDALPGVGFYSSDPAVAYNANGNAFFNYLEDVGYGYQLFVKKSTDGGINWQNGVQIPGLVDPDKNHVIVDVTSSLYRNYVYVACTESINYAYSPVKFSRSINGGDSFSTPVNISGNVTSYFSQGVNLSIGPSGEVYAAWAIADDWPLYYGDPQTWDYASEGIGFPKSTDGGVTWQPPARIFNIDGSRDFWTNKNPLGSAAPIRMNDFPSIAVDRSGGIWNGTIYLVYGAKGQGFDRADIMFCKSTNGGTNWSTPARVNDDNTSNDQWFPWIAIDPYGAISVVFYDSRYDEFNQLTEVWVAQSADGGESFTNSMVSDQAFMPYPIGGNYMGDYLGMTSKVGKAYPCWMDNRNDGIYQVYTDIVDTYQADLLALAYSNKSDYYAATSYNNNHILEKDGSGYLQSVFVSGGEIFYRRSTNGGSTWDIVTRISDGNGLNAAPCISTAYDGTLHMVWQRSNGSNYDLCYARSTNLGSSWSTSTLTYTAVAGSYTGQGLNPVILGMNGSQRKLLCVWAQSDGLHYKTSNSTTSWNGEMGIVPGTQYNGWVEHPSLASFGSSLTATTVIYDDTYNVYSNSYDANSNSWSSRATAESGSYARLSSISYTDYGAMWGVWSRFNGSQWVVRCSYGNSSSNSWNSFVWDFPTPSGLYSFYPSASWWFDHHIPSDGLTMVWSAYGNGTYTIQEADFDWENGWTEPYQISNNGIFGNLTHEWLWDRRPTITCTHMPSSPYHMDIAQPGGGLGKKAILTTASTMNPYRAAEIYDSKARVTLTVKFKGLNFKKYDYRKKLDLTLANVFDYLQTEDFSATAGGTMDVQVESSVMQQDTLDGKDVSKIDRNRFTSIDLTLDVTEGGSKVGEIALLTSAQAKSSQVKKSLSLDQFASRTIHLTPKVTLMGSFEEEDLSFALVNGVEESPGSNEKSPTELLPNDVTLGQNFPNPFNPTTTIAYRVSRPGKVSLKIFDMLGREVATLVNSEKAEGVYIEKFDASHLSSGIYFYQLIAPGVNETRKMLIAK